MKCLRCEHVDSDHCKGGVMHFNHKEESRMVPVADRAPKQACAARHCLQPLCSCVELILERGITSFTPVANFNPPRP